MKRIGEPWLAGKTYRDRIGAYGVLVRNKTLLCVEQKGELQLPGGGVDPGESPIRALHREVMEETGWRIGQPRRFGAFQRFAWLPEYHFWARKVQLIYRARPVAQLAQPSEPDHTPLWLEPATALRYLDIAGDRAMVRLACDLGLI